jgi:hypothetical protein
MPLLASKYATATPVRAYGTALKAGPKAAAPACTPGATVVGPEYTPANGAPVTKETKRAIKLTWMNDDVVQPSLKSWVTSHLKETDEPVTITSELEEVVGYNWIFEGWAASHAPGKSVNALQLKAYSS